MALKCIACGGHIEYNVEKNKLICPYCESEFELSDYNTDNSADVTRTNAAEYEAITGNSSDNEINNSSNDPNTYYMDIYSCKNCGATLSAPPEQAVAYCSYCNGEAILMQKFAPTQKPKDIIPFSKSKDDAREYYTKALSRKLYVPEEYKNADFIEGFRGIYIPYWRLCMHVEDKDLSLRGTKDYSTSSYSYHEVYKINAHVGGDMTSCAFDASKAFDDSIASKIAPFDPNESKPFQQGYFAGYYMDTPTATPDQYVDMSTKYAREMIKESIREQSHNVSINPLQIDKEIDITHTGQYISLFPVWFLTWKKGNRVAYSVMNGQNGKIAIDLPVDTKAFFKGTLLISIIIFALLSFSPLFMLPLRLTGLAAVLMLFSTTLLKNEIKKIYIREKHIYDYGYHTKKELKRIKLFNNKPTTCCFQYFGSFVSFSVLLTIGFSSITTITMPDQLKNILGTCAVLQILASVNLFIKTIKIDNILAVLPAIICVIFQFIGFSTAGMERPQDSWYFALSVMYIIGIIINALTSFYYLNYLTTRPVPNFFTREGGNNGRD